MCPHPAAGIPPGALSQVLLGEHLLAGSAHLTRVSG